MTSQQQHALAEVLTVDTGVLHGTAYFTNTRVPVQTLLDFLETGDSINDFLSAFPYIPRAQVIAFLERSRDIPTDRF
jgi:uncharacterized protein (DUF433 family)